MRQYQKIKWTTLKREIFATVLLFGLPISISAVLMGSFDNPFSTASADESLISENINSMKLLTAASSPLHDEEAHGEVLEDGAIMPASNPLGADADLHKPGSDKISIYVVRPGDTISQIAEMFDVSINTIRWSNNMTSNTLKPGETLVILPISGVKYTVAKGDTLASIAKKYKGDLEEIAAYNGVTTDSNLAVGTTIIIPDGEIVTPASSHSASGSSSVQNYSGYYIRPIVGGRRTQGIHGHNGVDLASSYGTPILAAADGTVIIARSSGWNGGYGSYVVIKHNNGTETLYAHLSSVQVSVGDSVDQGDQIGAMGQTGKATGVHLHFEIRGAKNPF